MGIYVYDTDMMNGCPFVEEDGWDYTTVTFKEDYEAGEWPLESYVGPDGLEWKFYPEDVLFAQEEEVVY